MLHDDKVDWLLAKSQAAMELTVEERLKLYCAPRRVTVDSVAEGQSEEELHQFLDNHEIPRMRNPALPLHIRNGLDLANPATHCVCAGMRSVKAEDIRALWWQHGVIDFIRNRPAPMSVAAGHHFAFIESGYLKRLGEFLGEKRIAAYPTAQAKLAEAYAAAGAAFLEHNSQIDIDLDLVLDANGVHGDCPVRLAALRERCNYFYKHTSF